MLVLTRKLKETIRIGDDITVTILRVKGQAVRIGIEAPREIRVIRAELPVEDAVAEETAGNESTGGATNEPQVVQFRFRPDDSKAPLARFVGRGGLASLAATLATAGAVVDAK